jgi:hypothetical protein
VEIEAVTKGKSGRLRRPFNAAGFGPNCDPNQRPAFDVHHPRSTPPDALAPGPGPAPTRGEAPSGSPPGAGPHWQPER